MGSSVHQMQCTFSRVSLLRIRKSPCMTSEHSAFASGLRGKFEAECKQSHDYPKIAHGFEEETESLVTLWKRSNTVIILRL